MTRQPSCIGRRGKGLRSSFPAARPSRPSRHGYRSRRSPRALFRYVRRGGHVRSCGLCGAAVARIVKQRAEAAGLDPAEISAHSLRAGFVTSAAESGVSIQKIQETSGHKSTVVLAGYVRRVDMFKDHAGAAFL